MPLPESYRLTWGEFMALPPAERQRLTSELLTFWRTPTFDPQKDHDEEREGTYR